MLRKCFRELLSNKPNPNGDNISIYKAPVGHYMQAHSDCADSSPLIAMIYLRDEDWDESNGGCVVIREAVFDSCGGRVVDSSKSEVRVAPKHGTVVFLNNTTPCYTHEVERVLSGVRYSYIFNLSMLTNPSWSKDFDDTDGSVYMNSLLERSSSN